MSGTDKRSRKFWQFWKKGDVTVHSHGKRPEGAGVDKKKCPVGRFLRPAVAVIVAAGILAGSTVAVDRTAHGTELQLAYSQRADQSEHSKYVEELNSRFGTSHPDGKRIIFLDSDYVDQIVSLSSYIGHSKTRQEAMENFAEKHGGVRLNPYYLHWLEQELMLELNPSSRTYSEEDTLILKNVNMKDGATEACFVVPGWSELDSKEIGAMFVGVPTEAFHFLDRDGKEIKISGDDMRRFIDYHEYGHCMDQKYVTKLGAGGMEGAWVRHLGETFGDVRSALQAAKEGRNDISLTISDMRQASSYGTGPQRARLPAQYGWARYSAGVYTTSFALEAVHEWLEHGGREAVQKMSPQEINDLGYKFTDEHAMTLDQFKQLYQYHLNGQAYLDQLTAASAEDPAAKATLDFLNQYIQMGKDSIKRTVDIDKYRAMRGDPTYQFRELIMQLTAQAEEQDLWNKLEARARARGGLGHHFADEIQKFRDDVRGRMMRGEPVSNGEKMLAAQAGMHLAATEKKYQLPDWAQKYIPAELAKKLGLTAEQPPANTNEPAPAPAGAEPGEGPEAPKIPLDPSLAMKPSNDDGDAPAKPAYVPPPVTAPYTSMPDWRKPTL
jgi:hypothetical protein